jgi:hypothetical protein
VELNQPLICGASWWLINLGMQGCSHGDCGSSVDFHVLEIQDCKAKPVSTQHQWFRSMIKVNL